MRKWVSSSTLTAAACSQSKHPASPPPSLQQQLHQTGICKILLFGIDYWCLCTYKLNELVMIVCHQMPILMCIDGERGSIARISCFEVGLENV